MTEYTLASICGLPRCGTTWLLHALAAHPLVLGVGECDFVGKVENNYPDLRKLEAAMFSGSPWAGQERPRALGLRGPVGAEAREPTAGHHQVTRKPNRLHHFAADAQAELREGVRRGGSPGEILQRLFGGVRRWKPGARVVVMKAPQQLFRVETVKRWLPECRLIVITRDGRDAAVSSRHMDARNGRPQRSIPEYGERWAESMELYRRTATRHDVHLVRYEALHADFRDTMAAVLRHLGLDPSLDLIDDMWRSSSFENLSGRARGEEDRRSTFRKGVTGDWRGTLTQEELLEFSRVAGQALVDWGYEAS